MPTVDECMRCDKPCPQAKLAHDTAVARMHVTNELLSYVKKVDSGQLVEVVRCRDCNWCNEYDTLLHRFECRRFLGSLQVRGDDFCSYGRRKDGDS